MMFREQDPRALGVLARALHSTSRVTRLRAVAMLARVDCPDRLRWLEAACADGDEAVVATALGVLSWVVEPSEPTWPQREDPRFDRVAEPPAETVLRAATDSRSRWRWEYVVEVWREDGLLIGSYVAATCDEDDVHAKRIALGQAILANADGRGDAFDTGAAAAFIVAKRRLPGSLDPRDRGGRGSGRGLAI